MTKCLPSQQKVSGASLGIGSQELRRQGQRDGERNEDPKTVTLDDIDRNGPFCQPGSWSLENVSFHLKCKNCKGKVATEWPWES